MLDYFPKFFTSKAIYLYIVLVIVVSLYFNNYIMPFTWWVFGLVEVIGFFFLSNHLTKKWSSCSQKLFLKRIFLISLFIRILWVIFSYIFYLEMTGEPFEFLSADAINYHKRAIWINYLIDNNNFEEYIKFIKSSYSDAGYPTYLSIIYRLTDDSIIVARLLKAIYGALMAVLVYKLTLRNFGDSTARIAAIFVALMPNLILYTGLHLKETEMVLLSVFFIERSDHLLRSEKFKFWDIITTFVLAGVLFLFRTPLGITALFALFTALFFSSEKVMKINRKLVIGVWATIAVVFLIGGVFSVEVNQLWSDSSENQDVSIEWRAKREGGNQFATYASKSVFAPAIFIIPLPTIVRVDGQENQMLINGGNFVKNILAFFAMFALVLFIKEKKWRDYTLISSFTLGYLIIIALSAFAQSERFHQPVLPFLLILAAYGISRITNAEKKWFSWYLVFIFVAIVVWSWFKLAGRGMV
jgi:4-amino-4-deoxy-L-arabinose transferase-like glycosyltransferase